MTGWENQDLRALRLIGGGLGSFQVLKIEENRMTEQAPEQEMDETWDNAAPAAPAFGGATYPEYPYSLADHVYTWSPKLPDGSMLVIRAQSAEDLVKAVKDMGPLAAQLRAAWAAVLGSSAAEQGPQAPANFANPNGNFGGQPTPPPFGANVSVPAAPGYVGPPAPQAPAWGGQQQAPQGQWGGGAPQAPAQQQRKEYPAPQGWYKLNVPYPGGKDQLHALAAQQQIPKGNPNKGGMYNFFGLNPQGQPGKAWYCAPNPNVLQAFQQFSPMVG